DGTVHVESAVRGLIFHVVANGALRIADVVAGAAVGKADALVLLVSQSRVDAKSRDGGDHFEGRARGIQAIAGPVEQRPGSFAQGKAFLQQIRRRQVNGSEEIAVRGVHGYDGAFIDVLFGQAGFQNLT